MITYVQQAADSNHLFAHQLADGKLKAVLAVHPHGRDAFLIAMQRFIVEGVVAEKVGYAVGRHECEDRFLITPHHFGLVTVLSVIGLAILVKLTQILLVEFYQHNIKCSAAKIMLKSGIRKISNTF